jgi:hypothetical protein
MSPDDPAGLDEGSERRAMDPDGPIPSGPARGMAALRAAARRLAIGFNDDADGAAEIAAWVMGAAAIFGGLYVARRLMPGPMNWIADHSLGNHDLFLIETVVAFTAALIAGAVIMSLLASMATRSYRLLRRRPSRRRTENPSRHTDGGK